MYQYNVQITNVVDGDTYDMDVDLGFGLTFNIRIRLHGYDTPETWFPSCQEELEHGEKATKFVTEMFEQADQITIQTYKLGIYGRYDADVYLHLPDHNEPVLIGKLLEQNNLLKRENYQ